MLKKSNFPVKDIFGKRWILGELQRPGFGFKVVTLIGGPFHKVTMSTHWQYKEIIEQGHRYTRSIPDDTQFIYNGEV